MKTLPKEDIKMVSKYMKKMLNIISHNEMQVKPQAYTTTNLPKW